MHCRIHRDYCPVVISISTIAIVSASRFPRLVRPSISFYTNEVFPYCLPRRQRIFLSSQLVLWRLHRYVNLSLLRAHARMNMYPFSLFFFVCFPPMYTRALQQCVTRLCFGQFGKVRAIIHPVNKRKEHKMINVNIPPPNLQTYRSNNAR